MSDTRLNKDNLELETKNNSVNKVDKNYSDLQKKIHKLKNDNQILIKENGILKNLIIENTKPKFKGSLIEGDLLKPVVKYPKIGKSFYIQIFLGIFVIILSLGFHILYLSVTSCLTYSDGNTNCWIVNWLGIDIHASFYLDVFLYSLIAIQITLIFLIIRTKLNRLY